MTGYILRLDMEVMFFAHFAPLLILQGFAFLAVKNFTATYAEIHAKDAKKNVRLLASRSIDISLLQSDAPFWQTLPFHIRVEHWHNFT